MIIHVTKLCVDKKNKGSSAASIWCEMLKRDNRLCLQQNGPIEYFGQDHVVSPDSNPSESNPCYLIFNSKLIRLLQINVSLNLDIVTA